MATFSSDFSSVTVGQFPSGWTSRWQAGTWTVEQVAGALGGKVLRHSGSTSGRKFLSFDAAGTVDPSVAGVHEMLAKVRVSGGTPSNSADPGVRLVAYGAVGSETAFYADLADGAAVRLRAYDTAAAFVGFGQAAMSLPAGTWIWVRARLTCTGGGSNVLRYRAWVDGGTEPATWFVPEQNVDTYIVTQAWGSGRFGVGAADAPTISGGVFEWDYVSVGTNGDAAPEPVSLTPPTADTGPGQTVVEGSTVNLDGSGSTAAAGGTITGYAWTVVDDGGTGLTTADIASASSVSVWFTAPQVGPSGATVVVQLRVTQSDGQTDTDALAVTVTDAQTTSQLGLLTSDDVVVLATGVEQTLGATSTQTMVRTGGGVNARLGAVTSDDTVAYVPDVSQAVYHLAYSTSPDRSSPGPLDGATIAGTVYVFLRDSTGEIAAPADVDDVEWRYNGVFHRTDLLPPFDWQGTAASGDANPLDTTTLPNGPQTFTAQAIRTDGTTVTVDAAVTVANAAQPLAVDAGTTLAVQEGGGFARTAQVSGGAAPYTYVWTVDNAAGTGMVDGDLVGAGTPSVSGTAPQVTTGANVVLRCTVTDGNSTVVSDTFTLAVSDATSGPATPHVSLLATQEEIDVVYAPRWAASWKLGGVTNEPNHVATVNSRATSGRSETVYQPSSYLQADWRVWRPKCLNINSLAFRWQCAGNTADRDAVIAWLVAQAGVSSMNASGWPRGEAYDSGFAGAPDSYRGWPFAMAHGFKGLANAYSIVKPAMTSGQQTTVATWLGNFADFLADDREDLMTNPSICDSWTLGTDPSAVVWDAGFASSPWQFGDRGYYNSPQITDAHNMYNNRWASMALATTAIGIVTATQRHVDHGIQFFKEALAFGWHPEGFSGDFHRLYGSGPSLSYPALVLGEMCSIADLVGRHGYGNLFDYTTTVGVGGSNGTPTNTAFPGKSLRWAIYEMGRHWNGTYDRPHGPSASDPYCGQPPTQGSFVRHLPVTMYYGDLGVPRKLYDGTYGLALPSSFTDELTYGKELGPSSFLVAADREAATAWPYPF